MLWRHLCLVRAITAAGLLTCSTLGASAAGEPQEPIPGADAQAETVKVLDAEKAGHTRRRGPRPGAGPGPGDPQEHLDQAAQRRPPARPGRLQLDRPGRARVVAAAAAASRAWAWARSTNRSGGFGQFAGTTSSARLPLGPPERRLGFEAGRDRARRPEGRRRYPRGLPQLRPAHPDPPRQVPAGRRGRLLEGRPGPQGPPMPWRASAPATGRRRPPCGGSATTCRSR